MKFYMLWVNQGFSYGKERCDIRPFLVTSLVGDLCEGRTLDWEDEQELLSNIFLSREDCEKEHGHMMSSDPASRDLYFILELET